MTAAPAAQIQPGLQVAPEAVINRMAQTNAEQSIRIATLEAGVQALELDNHRLRAQVEAYENEARTRDAADETPNAGTERPKLDNPLDHGSDDHRHGPDGRHI